MVQTLFELALKRAFYSYGNKISDFDCKEKKILAVRNMLKCDHKKRRIHYTDEYCLNQLHVKTVESGYELYRLLKDNIVIFDVGIEDPYITMSRKAEWS